MALKRIRIIKEYLATSNNAAGRFHDFYVDKRSMYIQRAAETYIGICRGGTTKICMLNLPKSFIWILRGATAVSRLKAHAGFVSMCLLIFRYSLNYRKIEPFIFLGYDSRGEPFFLFFFFSLLSLSLSPPPSLPLSLSSSTFIQHLARFLSFILFALCVRRKYFVLSSTKQFSLCKFFLLLKPKTARSGQLFL